MFLSRYRVLFTVIDYRFCLSLQWIARIITVIQGVEEKDGRERETVVSFVSLCKVISNLKRFSPCLFFLSFFSQAQEMTQQRETITRVGGAEFEDVEVVERTGNRRFVMLDRSIIPTEILYKVDRRVFDRFNRTQTW